MECEEQMSHGDRSDISMFIYIYNKALIPVSLEQHAFADYVSVLHPTFLIEKFYMIWPATYWLPFLGIYFVLLSSVYNLVAIAKAKLK